MRSPPEKKKTPKVLNWILWYISVSSHSYGAAPETVAHSRKLGSIWEACKGSCGNPPQQTGSWRHLKQMCEWRMLQERHRPAVPLWSCLMSASAGSMISFHFRIAQVSDVSPFLGLSVFLHATSHHVSAFHVDPQSFCGPEWVLL